MKSTRKEDTVHTWHRVEANRGWRRPVGLVGTKQTPTRHPQPRTLIHNCEALVGVKLGLRAHGITNAIVLLSSNPPMVRQCVCRQRVRQQQISRCPRKDETHSKSPCVVLTPCTHHRTPCTHDRAPLYMEPYLLPGASGHSRSINEKRPSAICFGSSKQSPTARIDHYSAIGFRSSNFRRLLSGLGVPATGTASLREWILFWGVSMSE